MNFPVLKHYLQQLQAGFSPSSHLSLDQQGRAHGRFFKARLSSVFQAIRSADGTQVIAYEAYARSLSADDSGLSIWKLLEHVASDEESVELDRLCRLLHTINYFRQAESFTKDLYLSVHNRLLVAVAGNHGAAFRRVLESLEVPQHKIILQLPMITASQRWVLTHVAENYRRNGFRLGTNARSVDEALDHLSRIRPASIKLDIDSVRDAASFDFLLSKAAEIHCQIIVRKIERESSLQALSAARQTGLAFAMQGFHFDLPRPQLLSEEKRSIETNIVDTSASFINKESSQARWDLGYLAYM
ncbi:EAL domain-containing protein [Undibacterium amnicola]|uniref:EAL domain-containing protein n=1 Tax=Undibacterium amnicola TaxID=1834038 RepID=A0ABR6XTN7_9BURK|nr:EAL domain-containing protein [Undibacterium amnicola]MBC3832733.1 EAL domain-containing protein [Undibacterium amnicola]